MTVLVTGASGFVGRNLCWYLAPRHSLRLAVRARGPSADELRDFGELVVTGDLSGLVNWGKALDGVRAVVHLANRAHVMHETAVDAAAAFRAVNVDGTRRLAEQAAAAGVRRLVYLSSVKVLGERTVGRAFDDLTGPAPADPYAQSKWDAERALQDVGQKTGLETVVLRPPLVYGAGVSANFQRLLRLISSGVPLPLAGIRNRRSLIYVNNLSSAVEICLDHAAAAGKTFLVSDGGAISTAQLVSMLAAALGVPDRSWSLSPALLRLAGIATGKGAEVSRLLDSLEVDGSGIRRTLQWSPPFSMEEGLRATASAYRQAAQ